jgi:hypothetical protein
MILRPSFTPAPSIKILINIGALMDIPTGFYLRGKYGESILNGGLGALTGVVGIGNNFKSTIMHYMMLSAASKIAYATETSMTTYDTEVNIHEEQLRKFAKKIELFKDQDIFDSGLWTITDKTVYYANDWYEILKDFLKHKKQNASKIMVETPFLDRDKQLLKIMTPTFSEVDSLSEFETADVAKIKDDNELGDSGGNMIHARQGLAKTRFLMDMPIMSSGNYHFMLMTAQIGKQMQMASGPVPQAPTKKLNYLKNGDTLKGVTDKFTFLMSNCWHAYNATPLLNQSTKGPEYPRHPDDNKPGDTDLNIVSLRQLRSKSGPSGTVIDIVVSQSEGVIPELTEFHYIKNSDRYGISGSLQNYVLDLLPDVKLSRTTVRTKLAENPKLKRALNITAELCQMKNLWRDLEPGLLCEPKQLYNDLIQLGYDWDILLNTRGWWTVDNDKQTIPFLSTMDLLRMRKNDGSYFPYWLNEDKKSLR